MEYLPPNLDYLVSNSLPDFQLYHHFLEGSFVLFRDLIFPIRTTLVQHEFLESSLEIINVDWVIFVNSIKSSASNDNALVAPISQKTIQCFRFLCENKPSSQEAMILLNSLHNFVQKMVDSSMVYYTSIVKINRDLNNIYLSCPDAIYECKNLGKNGVARDISELRARISPLLDPLAQVIDYANQTLVLWENISSSIKNTMEVFKINSVKIDSSAINFTRRRSLKNLNTNTQLPNTQKPSLFSKFFKSNFSKQEESQLRKEFHLYKIEQKAAIDDSESKTAMNIQPINKRNSTHLGNHSLYFDSVRFNTLNSKSGSNNMYLSRNTYSFRSSTSTPLQGNYQNHINGRSSEFKSRINTDIDQKYNARLSSSPGKSDGESLTNSPDNNKNQKLGFYNENSQKADISYYSPSLSASTLVQSPADLEINPVPSNSIYWIGKNMNKIVSEYDEFTENCIVLLEQFLA
ncbi:hypothetical protein BB560_004115 [Smittium megazygosporum]|uniref:Uncharacterized protein n=1 Tax=Smittium megazygosporum TaxID=133381 RepID=A0A2T9ZA65_9FUNG|nr:hypothetical protein BB560_004115 [Smittium megazygosporum]